MCVCADRSVGGTSAPVTRTFLWTLTHTYRGLDHRVHFLGTPPPGEVGTSFSRRNEVVRPFLNLKFDHFLDPVS